MKKRVGENESANESRVELKYCERCGGLWLRPVGGGQVYCNACGRAIAELPSGSYGGSGAGNARLPLGPQWGNGSDDPESYEEYDLNDLDAVGGVA